MIARKLLTGKRRPISAAGRTLGALRQVLSLWKMHAVVIHAELDLSVKGETVFKGVRRIVVLPLPFGGPPSGCG
jgi:hypothetical protein